MNTVNRILAIVLVATATSAVHAQSAAIIGGSTSVLLDTDTLSTAAGLNLTGADGITGVVTIPGAVAFPITSGTTFAFTPGDFPGGPFSGAIEHTGTVTFNDTTTVGDFTIGFDVARVGGLNSGFFVESTTGVEAILFDAQVTGLAEASEFELDLSVDLVVSPEFASFLGNTGLTGADVGDARIVGAVPEPTSLAVLGAGLIGVAAGRRRR